MGIWTDRDQKIEMTITNVVVTWCGLERGQLPARLIGKKKKGGKKGENEKVVVSHRFGGGEIVGGIEHGMHKKTQTR